MFRNLWNPHSVLFRIQLTNAQGPSDLHRRLVTTDHWRGWHEGDWGGWHSLVSPHGLSRIRCEAGPGSLAILLINWATGIRSILWLVTFTHLWSWPSSIPRFLFSNCFCLRCSWWIRGIDAAVEKHNTSSAFADNRSSDRGSPFSAPPAPSPIY